MLKPIKLTKMAFFSFFHFFPHSIPHTGANMTNFEVRVGSSKNFEDNDLCGNVTYDVQDSNFIYCNGEMWGRYVSIQTVNDNAQLYVCHMQAYYSKLTKISACCSVFIHSYLISCSLIGSSVNARSVLKMSTELRVLRTDCARCFWCVIP